MTMNTTTVMMASQSQTRTWFLGTTTNLTTKQSSRMRQKRFADKGLSCRDWCDHEPAAPA